MGDQQLKGLVYVDQKCYGLDILQFRNMMLRLKN